MTRRLASLFTVLVLAGALAACATPAGSGRAPAPTPTASASEPPTSEIGAAWLDGGRIIGLVTYGSSTCVPSAVDATAEGDAMSVTLEEPADVPCTRDYAPRATLVQAPAGVDPSQQLQIEVSGAVTGSTSLGGVGGLAGGGETDYLPSAGWTGTDGQFIVVTWGSSGCPPVLQDAAATGPAEVTVTFETPPADQVCTMDMGPRATLVEVTGLESTDTAEAILTGGEFDDVRVPILGSP